MVQNSISVKVKIRRKADPSTVGQDDLVRVAFYPHHHLLLREPCVKVFIFGPTATGFFQNDIHLVWVVFYSLPFLREFCVRLFYYFP